MAKQQLSDIQSGLEGWDATLNDDISILRDDPLPIVEYASVGSLPAANINDRSIAMADHADLGWIPLYSDGTNWRSMAPYSMIIAGGATGGATTQLNLAVGENNTVVSLGVPMMEDGLITYYAISTQHANGSAPAAWTLTVTNVTAATSATGTVNWNAANNTYTATAGALSSPLAVSKLDEINFRIAGASISSMVATAFIYVQYNFTEVAP